jgi:hypothetical protein
MTFLLITLSTFATVVTVTGFFLSSKSRAHNQRAGYALAPASRRFIEPYSRRRAAEAEPLRRRQVVDAAPFYERRVAETASMTRRHTPVPLRSHRYTIDTELPAARSVAIPAPLGPLGGRQAGEPINWQPIAIGLVCIFIFGFFTLNFVLPHRALSSFVLFNQDISAAPPQKPAPAYQVAQHLVRIGQLDPAQYASAQEYNLWAYSTCSTAAMTAVMDAYGRHYRITDVLQVEARIGEITPQLGLLEEAGIARTVAYFGFKTTWGHNLTLDQVIAVANHGKPVIVGFPPDRYDGGHLIVVIGGNGSQVFVADSSLWNRHAISRAQFLAWWEGFSAIVTPN